MCLIVFAWQAHPHYPLILAANRDERHDRLSRAAHWWPEAAGVFGGRDGQAGGAWCAADTTGQFAAVTNVHDSSQSRNARSRGALVYDYLAASESAPTYCEDVAPRRSRFRPFNLLVGDRDSLFFMSNRGATQQRELGPGVYALSNGLCGDQWPKTETAKAHLHSLMDADRLDSDALFGLLAGRRYSGTRGAIPSSLRGSIFIRGAIYGTRAATELCRDCEGQTTFHERGFDRSGRMQYARNARWVVRDLSENESFNHD